jgi:hypothetical protein
MNDAQVEVLRSYLRHLGLEVREWAIAGVESFQETEDENARAVTQGYVMALRQVIDFMQRQGDAYELSYRDLGVDGIDPAKDLEL